MTDRYEIVVHRSYQEFLTLEGLARAGQVHPSLVERFVEFGLLEPAHQLYGERFFAPEAVPRLRTIQRLRREMGVSLPGIAIVLELTDKLRCLQQEVEWLRQRLDLLR